MLKKAAFIDRDGTINVEKGYVHRIEDFEFLPGALDALRLFSEHNIALYVLTNQAGIAKGYYTEEQFQIITDHMLRVCESANIKIDKVLYCPHHPDGVVPGYAIPCKCRKPNTLLIEQVIAKNDYSIRDLVLIGDKKSDIDAGTALGMDTYLVLTGYGREQRSSTAPTQVAADLLAAARHIVGVC